MSEKYQLKRPESIKKKKRLGCGTGSGKGKTSGKGQKGQMSRSGVHSYAWFEGGQMPLQRRIPKRGFSNKDFRNDFQVVNLGDLGKIDANDITPAVLKAKGLIKNANALVKVLSKGELSKSMKITADQFSKTAEEKIKKAGGETVIRKYSERTKSSKNTVN